MQELRDLLVGNFMSKYPVSVKPDVSFENAVKFMAENKFSTLIVMDEKQSMPLGVFTERGILKHVSSEKNIHQKINQEFIQPFISVNPDTLILDTAKMMISTKSRILVFAEDKLLGIVTASDMLRAFACLQETPDLVKVTSKTVFHCPFDTSILDVVKLLDEKNIGSIIVTQDSTYGIFTQRDLVRILTSGEDLNNNVGLYSSFPLFTATRDILANEAAKIMSTRQIKRLGLTEDDSLIGIVTARDIVDAYQMYL